MIDLRMVMPYSIGKNPSLGRKYNQVISELPDAAAVCLMDQDCVPTTNTEWFPRLTRLLEEHPNSIILPVMNRPTTCENYVKESPPGDDMRAHREFGEYCERTHGDDVEPVTNINVAGTGMTFTKATWEKLGRFNEELMFLGVDTDFFRKVQASDVRFFKALGVYFYHWYRGGEMHLRGHLIPKMLRHLNSGQLDHTMALIALAKNRQARSYLEIGVDKGSNFLAVPISKRVGVDPRGGVGGVLACTSDQFFARHCQQRFDLVFVDGLHVADQALRDIYASLAVLNPGGMVACHDVLPETIAEQDPTKEVQPGESRRWTGDVWRAVLKVSTIKGLRIRVLDADFGLAMIERGKAGKYYSGGIDPMSPDLTWEEFDRMKWRWLERVTPEQFVEEHGAIEVPVIPPPPVVQSDAPRGWTTRNTRLERREKNRLRRMGGSE